ncbi:MAG: hypothetical protein NVV73_08505 [Cellvibrionaceae bacterium]|nr:hypothetical protein [Cellvibrionaceae bacterium]
MRLLENIHSFDIKTFDWCLRRKNRAAAIDLAKICSYTANGPLYVLVGLLFAMLQNWGLVQLLIAAFALERACYFIFKALFPPQPPTGGDSGLS